MTIKSLGEMVRHETELNISEDKYESLHEIFCKDLIVKIKRNYILDDGKILECNLVDKGRASEFMYAEVEFSSEEEALAWTPPDFLYKEVTFDNKYKMNNYWKRTRIPNGRQ